MELQQAGQLAQLEVNAVEAKHASILVAGWRPFIGWVCGLSFAWNFVVQPMFTTLILYVASINGADVDLSGVPLLDLEYMMPVLLGMLGLGAMRSFEKKEGVASKTLKG